MERRALAKRAPVSAKAFLRSVVLAGLVWSGAECVDLVAGSALRFAFLWHWPLFFGTHLAIAVAASLMMAGTLELGTRAALLVLRLVAPRVAAREAVATALVLFGVHTAVWLAACVTGLYRGRTLFMAAGLTVVAGAAFALRGPLPWGSHVDRGTGRHLRVSAACFVFVLAAHLWNGHWHAKIYFPLHVAIATFAVTASLFGDAHLWRALSRPERRQSPSPRATGGVVVALLLLPVVLFGLSNDVRHTLFNRAFDTKSVLYLARKLRVGGLGGRAARATMPVTSAAPPTRIETSRRRVDRVLLITIDTVRADHLPLYGYNRDTAPNIGALARQGATFDWAWSDGAQTVIALQAIFGSHGPRPPLTQTLAAAGVPTRAVVSLPAAEHTGGFGSVATISGDDDARVAAAAAAEIEGGHFQGLLWVHLYDPHRPYSRRGPTVFGDTELDRYDGEILGADRAVGRVLAALDRAQLVDSTAVIVTADHGEEFGEHGGEAHAWDIYNELVRVPLIVRLPGATPRRVAAHVTQRDLAPTVIDLLGVAQSAGRKNRSLVPLVQGAERGDDRVVMIGPISTFLAGAVMSGRWKLAYGLFNGSFALYDLIGDPGERLNLFEAKPELARRMGSLMRDLLDDPYDLGPAVIASDGELGWKPVAASAHR